MPIPQNKKQCVSWFIEVTRGDFKNFLLPSTKIEECDDGSFSYLIV